MDSNAIQAEALPPPTIPLWRQLFDQAVAKHGPVNLAVMLGYANHTLISRIKNGHIQASSQFQQRVLDRLHVVAECPATGLEEHRSHCRQIAGSPAPTHNPLAMRIWKVCQTCAHNPEKETAR